MLTYAFGDLHGEIDRLERAMHWIVADRETTPCRIIFLGDYIDRGPDSKGVVAHIKRWVAQSEPGNMEIIALQGNHEEWAGEMYPMMTAQGMFTKDEAEAVGHWLKCGADKTLASYSGPSAPMLRDIKLDTALWEEHLEWMKALPLYYDDGERLFVHSCVHMELPLDHERQRQIMLWVRPKTPPPYQQYIKRQVVHGHTPCGDYPRISPDEVNLDTGCGKGGILSVGKFVAGENYPTIKQF